MKVKKRVRGRGPYNKWSGVHTIAVEVGPCTANGRTGREAMDSMRQLRDDIDALVRHHMSVGPYSQTVRTTMKKVGDG